MMHGQKNIKAERRYCSSLIHKSIQNK